MFPDPVDAARRIGDLLCEKFLGSDQRVSIPLVLQMRPLASRRDQILDQLIHLRLGLGR